MKYNCFVEGGGDQPYLHGILSGVHPSRCAMIRSGRRLYSSAQSVSRGQTFVFMWNHGDGHI